MISPELPRIRFQESLSALAQLAFAIPPHRPALLLQNIVSFRSAEDLSTEFTLGPLRAAFAEVWESRFGTTVPVKALQILLTPPVLVGTVLEFRRLGFAGDCGELAEAISQLVTHLAGKVGKIDKSRQQTLFVEDVDEFKATPSPAIGGRTVTRLAELVEQRVTFPTIYADPPWQYDNESARGAAARHYSTMSVEQMCKEPVRRLAAKNAHLHLWTTNGFLREAFAVIDAWGFKFKSCFVWVKDGIGTGNYWRVSHEFLLLVVRGSLTFRD